MGNLCAGEDKKGEVIEQTAVKDELKEPPKEEASAEEPKADEPEPKLLITIVGAQGVRNSDWMPGSGGKPDCYCELKAGGKLLYTTAVLTDMLEPVWGEECKVTEIADDVALEFSVYDKDLVGSDFLGKAVLEAKDYAEEGFNSELKLVDPKTPQATILVKVKVAGKDLPPGPPPEFTLTVEKPSKESSYGLALDPQDGKSLFVMDVRDGPFAAYNSASAPPLRVKPNDFIVSVNGTTGSSADMLKQFGQSLKAECKVVRSVKTTILFDRGDKSTPLGIEFPAKAEGSFLVITGITPKGAAEASNAAANDQDKMMVGDRISAVNGKIEKAPTLKQMLEQKTGKIQVAITRQAITEKKGEDEGEAGRTGFVHWLFS